MVASWIIKSHFISRFYPNKQITTLTQSMMAPSIEQHN